MFFHCVPSNKPRHVLRCVSSGAEPQVVRANVKLSHQAWMWSTDCLCGGIIAYKSMSICAMHTNIADVN